MTNDSFKILTHRASKFVLAVAQACDRMGSIPTRLEQDLQQLAEYILFPYPFADFTQD